MKQRIIICSCICKCEEPVLIEGDVCLKCQPNHRPDIDEVIMGSKDLRVDIKGILGNVKQKAELIANAVKSSRFFK